MNIIIKQIKPVVDQLEKEARLLLSKYEEIKHIENPQKLKLIIKRTSEFGISIRWRRTTSWRLPNESFETIFIRAKKDKNYSIDSVLRFAQLDDHHLIEELEEKLAIIRKKVASLAEINRQVKKLNQLNT